MKKQTRKEKKAEERRIIEEMKAALAEAEAQDAALAAEAEENGKAEENAERTESRSAYGADGVTPAVLHCRRCKTLMENGVCPQCGYKVYIPMDKRKQDKIKLIATGVCMAVFLVIFLLIQISRSS